MADFVYTMEPAKTDRTFGGIGGVADSSQLLYSYPEPQRSQILDYLFKPNYGLAAHILKLEIDGDTNNTVGAESSPQHSKDGPFNINNGYETWLAKEARAQSQHQIMGVAVGAPGWLKSICSQADADYVVNWLKEMQALNLAADYISAGQNEANCVADSETGSRSDAENITNLGIIDKLPLYFGDLGMIE